MSVIFLDNTSYDIFFPLSAQFFGGTIILVGVSVSLSAFGIYFHFHELNLKPPPTWLRSVLLVDG